MQTALSQTHSEAWNTHLSFHGEELSFRSTTLRALVNRTNPAQPERAPKGHQRDAGDTSTIEFETALLDTSPEPGEYFTDEFGYYHRVQTVKRFASRTLCSCDVSNT